MTSIVGKRRGEHTYYYLVESARVDGTPRIVSQEYLGTADDVMARLGGTSAGDPVRTQHKRFGDIAAVWGMIEDLDVVGIIDRVVGERRSDAAASIGTYLALATVNRIVDPCSKLGFADWWASTSGERFIRPRLSAAALDHRRFWDAMDAVSVSDLVEIEQNIATTMIQQFDLEMSGVVLDMTNFATFIDSANTRAPIAQRGKAKQKRTDLRLIGLSLVVTRDGQIPVLSHTYPGNLPDVTQFSTVLNELLTRWSGLGGDPTDLTVTYDAGQNSTVNHSHVEASGIGFVTSLPPSQHPDLLAVPHSDYTIVDEERFKGLTAYDTTTNALGVTRRTIITHSPTFHDTQTRGFDQTLTKAHRQLTELQTRLARGATRKTATAIRTEIDQILKPRWLRRVITATVTGNTATTRRLTWHINNDARQSLEDEYFGKRILFTNRNDWTVADVVGSYRSQNDVEASFRQLKDPKVVSFTPMFHFTDHKIRVHTFTCVLALQIAHLMRRHATQNGLDLSIRRLLAALAGIQETVLLYQGNRGRPRARRIITDLDPNQKHLYNLFNLDRHAPRR